MTTREEIFFQREENTKRPQRREEKEDEKIEQDLCTQNGLRWHLQYSTCILKHTETKQKKQ